LKPHYLGICSNSSGKMPFQTSFKRRIAATITIFLGLLQESHAI
jgi:hypothetical protein